jgi:hypothetical protein
MLNQLFKRMAPLVAGVMLASTSTGVADFCYIQNIDWPSSPNDDTCTVYVATGQDIPTGYVEARTSNNYFWWFDSTQFPSEDGKTTANVYPGTQNVAVYVYSVDNDLSYASSDRSTGITIYNGP